MRVALAIIAALVLARVTIAACPPDCVAGGGPSSTDCLVEWAGIDGTAATCVDGAACDQDAAADGTCTFPLAACVGVDAGCAVSAPATAKVAPRKLPDAAALASAIGGLSPGQCTTPGFRVAVKRNTTKPAAMKPGVARVRVTASPSGGGKKDVDVLSLTCQPAQPSFATVQSLFTARCAIAGCHVAGSAALSGGLDLSAGSAHAALVGQPAQDPIAAKHHVADRVVAGNVKKSWLASKIMGANGAARMPSGCGSAALPCLGDSEIYTILAWIQAGAPAE